MFSSLRTVAVISRLFAPIVALTGLLILLPGLNGFGLWDPYEIRFADAAQSLAKGGDWLRPQQGRPALPFEIVALGFRAIGVNELGGRIPGVLLGLVAVLALYWGLGAVMSRRAAFFAGLALLSSPTLFLGARQLTIAAPLVTFTALALAGALRLAATGGGVLARLGGLVVLIVGLLGGLATAGLAVGVAAPLLALGCALLISSPSGHASRKLGWAVVAVAGATIAGTAWLLSTSRLYSALAGGTPHAPAHGTVLTSHLKQLGMGLFPWSVLFPVAAVVALGSADASPEAADADRTARLGRVLPPLLFALVYLASTVQAATVIDLISPVAPAVAATCGWYLDRLLDETEPLPLIGLLVALGAVIMGRDFFNFPEQYLGAPFLDAVRWPSPIPMIAYVLLGGAVLWGGLLALGVGVPLSSPSAPTDQERAQQQRRGRALLVGGSIAASVALALTVNQVVVPAVSRHLSARDVFGKTRQLDPNAPVGQYRFTATGMQYYAANRTPETLATVDALFTFLARAERVFVLAGANELAAIDQQARTRKQEYFVVDDSNSNYLVLSNKLGAKEKDLNQLRTHVSAEPPKPPHALHANFEDKLELLGYDIPESIERGKEFRVRLYFKVNASLGGSYKVFMHFDGPGNRINGDHVPLDGKFPTEYWVPGYYVTDEHVMRADRVMHQAGRYQVLMGLFQGDRRLKIKEGDQDGENRLRVTSLRVN